MAREISSHVGCFWSQITHKVANSDATRHYDRELRANGKLLVSEASVRGGLAQFQRAGRRESLIVI